MGRGIGNMRGISKKHLIFGVLLLVIISTGCTGGSEPTTAAPTTTAVVDEMNALEQMEIAFDGGYTKGEIKEQLDVAIDLYGLPITEENYQRAGSTLVALRKANGVMEMDILECMIQAHVPDVDIDFPTGAALCSATISAAPTTAPEPSENAERPSGAVQVVASSLGTNQLGITSEDLVSLENPKGEGTFVYVRQTEFAGVERYIIWLVLNDIAYPLNGATKDVTPSLPWPREAQADEWKKTGLSIYSATEAIEIVY